MTIVSPFPPEAAPELHRWLNSPRGPNFADGRAPSVSVTPDADAVAAQLAAKTAAGRTFALIRAGQPAGFIGFTPASREMGWFAGMVIAPEHRGHGCGVWFLRTVVRRLRGEGFRKLAAVFYADNAAIRFTFEASDAVEEGYLKQAVMRDGQMVDMRLWSFNDGGEI